MAGLERRDWAALYPLLIFSDALGSILELGYKFRPNRPFLGTEVLLIKDSRRHEPLLIGENYQDTCAYPGLGYPWERKTKRRARMWEPKEAALWEQKGGSLPVSPAGSPNLLFLPIWGTPARSAHSSQDWSLGQRGREKGSRYLS